MPDYFYEVRVYAEVNLLPRGAGGVGLAQNNANIGGVGPTQGPGTGPMSQTKRYQQREMVPNAIGTPPTAANFGTALTSAATDLQGQIATDIAMIQNWALGQP